MERFRPLLIPFIALLALGVAVFFYQQPLVAAALEAVLAFWALSVLRFRFWKTFVIMAFFGPTMEMVAVRAGVWHYAQHTPLGIPLWLPILWGLAAMYAMHFAVWVGEIPVKTKAVSVHDTLPGASPAPPEGHLSGLPEARSALS
jgi:hypothetical protein